MSTGVLRARYASLDALRGMAVLGILAVNAPFFAAPFAAASDPALWPFRPPTDWSLAVFAGTQIVFESKMVSMFSMLFGVSVFLVGGERGDPQRSPVLKRRLWWLLLFGFLHGLFVWFGDVLFCYAISGFGVVLLRSWPAGRLIRTGALIWAAFTGLLLLGGLSVDAAPAAGLAPAAEAVQASGYRGDFVASLLANMRDWSSTGVWAQIGGVFFTTPLMMIGLGLFKAGVLTGEARTRVYLGLIAAGAAGLAATAALSLAAIRSGFAGGAESLLEGVSAAAAPLITLGYGSLLILGLRAGGAAAWLPKLLQPVGRMAFTNYLTQSLIMTGLFYGGRGPGWFGEWDRPQLALVVVAVWALQIAWSHLWLARFRLGPFEWLWRSLVAGRAVPISGPPTDARVAP